MKAPEPASFYNGDAWQSEESIGYLIRQALAQAYNGHLQGFSPVEFDQLKTALRRLAKPQR
jgi:hypothetical protein